MASDIVVTSDNEYCWILPVKEILDLETFTRGKIGALIASFAHKDAPDWAVEERTDKFGYDYKVWSPDVNVDVSLQDIFIEVRVTKKTTPA